MNATMTGPVCPKCKGGMYDNRAENDERVARGEKLRPDYKCKQRNCDGVIWRPKNGNGQGAVPTPIPVSQASYGGPHVPAIDGPYSAPQVPVPTPPPVQPPQPSDNLFDMYKEITGWVLRDIVPLYAQSNVGASPESVAAMVATIYIQASKRYAA